MNKKFVFVSILVIFVLSLIAGVVSAQEGDGNGRGRGDNRGGRFGDRQQTQLRDHLHEVMDAIVAETGLEPQAILQQLRDGDTLTDIITANGGSVDNVIAVALGNVQERIAQAVENGNLTQERADELLASAEARITEWLNNPLPAGGFGLRDRLGERLNNRDQHFDGAIRQALEDAGLTVEEVREQLQNGATLRQILTDAGVDVDALMSEVLANAQTRLDEAVANNRITAEQATQRLMQIEERLNNLLDKTRPSQPRGV
jgi:uncharacterized protein (DUF433 family)